MSVPITSPKLVLAPLASEAPVPPSARDKSVSKLMLPTTRSAAVPENTSDVLVESFKRVKPDALSSHPINPIRALTPS